MRRFAATALAFALITPLQVPAQDRPAAQREAIENKLATMMIDVNFEDAPLQEVVGYLREYTGLNWLIDPGIDGTAPVTLRLKGVKVVTALRLALRHLDLAAIVRDGLLVIVPKEALHEMVVTRVYDIRDLLVKISNFAGPRLELQPGRGGTPFTIGVTIHEEPNPLPLDDATIEDLIRNHTGGESWRENPNAKIVPSPNGLLMVTQSKKVHAEIERLLGMLRWFR